MSFPIADGRTERDRPTTVGAAAIQRTSSGKSLAGGFGSETGAGVDYRDILQEWGWVRVHHHTGDPPRPPRPVTGGGDSPPPPLARVRNGSRQRHRSAHRSGHALTRRVLESL